LVRGDSPESTSTVEGGGGEGIGTVSIEGLCRAHGIDRIGVLKLDIEGAERHLFRAEDTSWLERVDVIVVEVADHEDPGGLQHMLRTLPYEVDCRLIGENVIAVRSGTGLSVESYRVL
jgi:hypothetical protein